MRQPKFASFERSMNWSMASLTPPRPKMAMWLVCRLSKTMAMREVQRMQALVLLTIRERRSIRYGPFLPHDSGTFSWVLLPAVKLALNLLDFEISELASGWPVLLRAGE